MIFFVNDLRELLFCGTIYTRSQECPCKLIFTGVSPIAWEKALRGFLSRWKNQYVESISAKRINRKYSIIINPFGDNYPEENLKTRKTFYELCNYVAEGGILIVTGGVFFWQQNPRFSVDTQQSITKLHIQGNMSVQNLKDTLLFQEFGVLTTGGDEPILIELDDTLFGLSLSGIKVKRFRAATIDEGTMNYIPILKQKDAPNIIPAVAVKYGEGFLLHFGFYLESTDSQEFKIVRQIINEIIKRHFKF